MHEYAHRSALEALRFWAKAANGDAAATATPDAVHNAAHCAARLVCVGDALPRLDVIRPFTTAFKRL